MNKRIEANPLRLIFVALVLVYALGEVAHGFGEAIAEVIKP